MKEIGEDLIASTFIRMTPPPFQHDAYDFLVERGIDVKKLLTANEIEGMLRAPYGSALMARKAAERDSDTTHCPDGTP
jgi:hypothetical protein